MRLLLITLTLSVGLSSALDKVLEFKKISRITISDKIMKDDVPHFEIEVTNSVASFDHFHLNIITAAGGSQYQGDSVTPTSKGKATFKGNLAEVITPPEEVRFVLTQRNVADDNAVSFGELVFTLPVFPTDVESTWVGVEDDYSLRITDKTKIAGFQVSKKDCTETKSGPCYYVDVTKDDEGEMCVEITSTLKGTFDLCDKTFTPDDVTGAIVNPATTELQYGAGGTAAKVLVTHPSTKDIGSTEVIVYKDGDDSTATACTASPCDITTSAANDVFTVITVGIDDSGSPAPVETGSATLTDYGLIGTVLSNTLIETRWTRQKTIDKYYVSTSGDVATFNETSATCADAGDDDNFHCFAYFTGLAQETTYPLTVKITEDAAPLLVSLTDTTTGKDEEDMEMKISSLNTKWNKGLRSLEVNACIRHVDTSDLSSYQAILINKIGQWKKINGVTHRIDNKFCFDELHVDIHNFNLSENLTLVAVKRGHDGITVLESVQTIVSV